MAAEPQPSSFSYRTTGSTCLHPLSELLGIPLDQVTAGRERGDPSSPAIAGEMLLFLCSYESIPAVFSTHPFSSEKAGVQWHDLGSLQQSPFSIQAILLSLLRSLDYSGSFQEEK
ncbi:Lysophospholipid acyltransferase 1 [Plecturocebus cupreus]